MVISSLMAGSFPERRADHDLVAARPIDNWTMEVTSQLA